MSTAEKAIAEMYRFGQFGFYTKPVSGEVPYKTECKWYGYKNGEGVYLSLREWEGTMNIVLILSTIPGKGYGSDIMRELCFMADEAAHEKRPI